VSTAHATTIPEYINAAAPAAQGHLRQLYRILKRIAPVGSEAMRWGVPVFWQQGVLFTFSAYPAHLSFSPGQLAVQHFEEELADYSTGKDAIQLPYSKPLPHDLLVEIAEFCALGARQAKDR